MEDERTGWFAYRPLGPCPLGPEPPVGLLSMRADEWASPFWDDEAGEELGDDFDDLHQILGISRQLYDAVMAWSEEHRRACLDGDPLPTDHGPRGSELRRRLAAQTYDAIPVVLDPT